MKIKIQCMMCKFKVEAILEKGASLTPKELESMAHWLDFEITPDGYICKKCLEKKTKGE